MRNRPLLQMGVFFVVGCAILIPITAAFAITLIVIGTTITWLLSIVGAVILVVCIVRWIGDTRRDVAALPEQHH